ncbi:MAG: MaoC family dehydratase [Peptostreptococcaceae bacterium]|nr:MaoC family dehydratase [Peptostreptococcaceae bacterium]
MSYTISNLELNQKASFTKTISESDVYLFAGITGDINPAHLNAIYAQSTRFKHRIVHGALLSGLISAVIGVHLPGSGTIYVAQNVKFLAPVYFGDTITATVEVIEIDKEKNRVKLKTICENQDGLLVVDGEANVMPPL